MSSLWSRRQAIGIGILGTNESLRATWTSAATPRTSVREKLPVAAIITTYRRSSHADVILGKILEGFRQDGGPGPDLQLRSLFVDQYPANDMSRGLAEKHGFVHASTIDEALTLGTKELQVAGVLSIGEHGDYPETPDTHQHMYPRRRFFEEIVATFQRCQRSVPVFNDKHLSYRWQDAKFMVETARSMGFPLMAGSSIPFALRSPSIELPLGCEIESALSLGYGQLEAYGFHTLEGHQCMIERRRGGETGCSSVEVFVGDRLANLRNDDRWSSELFEAILKVLPHPAKAQQDWFQKKGNAFVRFRHRDGLLSQSIVASGLGNQFAFAAKIKGNPKPIATFFHLEEAAPYGHFAFLLHGIEEMIHRRETIIPVERTLMTTGILDRIMHGAAKDLGEQATPELEFSYSASNWPFANRADARLGIEAYR